MANVLFVDDDMQVRELMDRILEEEGHCVLMAEDAETAMELVSQRPSWAEVIVSDLHMPGMGGRSFMTNYKAIKPDLPFILMSSSFTKDEMIEGCYQVPKNPLTIVEYISKVVS